MSNIFDQHRGQEAYFAAILLFRKMSIQTGDSLSRSSIILTQLWTSTKVFTQPDGSYDSFTLLCRTRYAMSSVFDVWWRWRNEFANQPHPYISSAGPSPSEEAATQPNPVAATGALISSDNYNWDALFSGPTESWDLFNLDNADLMFGDTLSFV